MANTLMTDLSTKLQKKMLDDVSESESEESDSEDDVVLAELIEANDSDSEQGTAGGSTHQDKVSRCKRQIVVCFSE